MEKILADIEAARKARQLNNEAANLATSALSLEGDEAMVGNRIVSRGSDPASLELIAFGKISDATRRAHAQGPGCLTAEEREPWLVLAAASLDESGQAEIPPSAKIAQFIEAVNWLRTATAIEKAEAAEREFEKIVSLPFEESEVSGVKMRLYTSDRGFAAAYWSGQEFAAVKEGGLTFIGSKGRTLEEIGIKVEKALSPTFGIIFPPKKA